ncbi:MAG: DEAD/DEAH box helicase, partial [Mucilaginibacter sp.]
QSGEAITFCTHAEQYYIGKIEKLIRQPIPVLPLPGEVFVEETPYEERQAQAKEVDLQKRKENPEFKGAFHEKKTVNQRKKFEAAKKEPKVRGERGKEKGRKPKAKSERGKGRR